VERDLFNEVIFQRKAGGFEIRPSVLLLAPYSFSLYTSNDIEPI
jgi:hypothetical protein